ncbi:hypothetical protein Tco_0644623 [Tanacetum coccineum]
MQGRCGKISRINKTGPTLPKVHICRLVKQDCNEIFKICLTCDPTKKVCNGGGEDIYGIDEKGKLREWYCFHDDKRLGMTGEGLSFPDYILVKYGGSHCGDLIWDKGHAEWHTNVPESVKRTLLKYWVIDYFEAELGPAKDPRARSFDDYKWVFNLEINQLADEYELGIGKKEHILEEIWENCNKVQGNDTYWWYDHWLKENETQEIGEEVYDPPKVHLETFEVLSAKKLNLKSSRLIIIWFKYYYR